MLKKLMKYDFRAVLRIWWIAAVAMVALSTVGGLCMFIVNSARNFPEVIDLLAYLGLVLTVIGFAVFVLLSEILLAMRFYKNFFTDEGYLTFTLPVSKGQLLGSKLIVSTVTSIMTAAVCVLSVFLMQLIGEKDFLLELGDLWVDFWKQPVEEGFLGWAILYLVEYCVILLLGTVFGTLFLDCCITFGSIVAKKAKVVASIAIYYGATNIFSVAAGIFLVFGTVSLSNWIISANLSNTAGYCLVALLLLGGISIFGLFCGLLYALQYWMLDRKLNLS